MGAAVEEERGPFAGSLIIVAILSAEAPEATGT